MHFIITVAPSCFIIIIIIIIIIIVVVVLLLLTLHDSSIANSKL